MELTIIIAVIIILTAILIFIGDYFDSKRYKQYIENNKKEYYIKFEGYVDPVKFYELYRHYDIISPNIGILGDYDKFKEITESYIKDAPKNATIIKSKDNAIVRIIDDNIETSYVFIQSSQDLIGKKFRKYL